MKKTTIEFSEQSSEKLSRLAKSLSTTKTDVLRSALSLYAHLEKELRGSSEKFLAIVDMHDEVQQIIVARGLQDRDVIAVRRGSQNSRIIAATAGGI